MAYYVQKNGNGSFNLIGIFHLCITLTSILNKIVPSGHLLKSNIHCCFSSGLICQPLWEYLWIVTFYPLINFYTFRTVFIFVEFKTSTNPSPPRTAVFHLLMRFHLQVPETVFLLFTFYFTWTAIISWDVAYFVWCPSCLPVFPYLICLILSVTSCKL